MAEAPRFPLTVVDGLRLEKPVRDALLPGRTVFDASGHERRLPRYFYEIPNWNIAMDLRLSRNFALWEFIQTDVREAAPLRGFPRYVPCAITMLALCIERFRDVVGAPVHVAANGGYRSPRHALSTHATPHSWGTAVNIYRIGDLYLNARESVERFSNIAQQELPGAWTRPFGFHRGQTDDHLHIDFGFVVSTPRNAPDDHRGFEPEEQSA